MAATDDGDDTIEIILCHWCTRRQAETVVEQILGHFTPHHACSVFALTLSHVSGVSRLSLFSSIEWPESSIKNLSRFSRSALSEHPATGIQDRESFPLSALPASPRTAFCSLSFFTAPWR
jgi:hypothetical protein